jgi:serine/threonine protein kinase
MGDILGRGVYGTVIKDGDNAIKMFSDDDDYTFINEADILMSMRHPNIILAHDVSIINGRDIILELGIPLCTFMKDPVHPVPPDERLKIIYSVGSGINFLLINGILHGDIKSDNVIMVNGIAKLADMGISIRIDPMKKVYYGVPSSCQTSIFRPIEYFNADEDLLHPQGEIWAFGLFVIGMIYNETYYTHIGDPIYFHDNDLNDIYDHICQVCEKLSTDGMVKCFGDFDPLFSPIEENVVKMLSITPLDRGSDLTHFLNHELFVDNEMIYDITLGEKLPEIWNITKDKDMYIRCMCILLEIAIKCKLSISIVSNGMVFLRAISGMLLLITLNYDEYALVASVLYMSNVVTEPDISSLEYQGCIPEEVLMEYVDNVLILTKGRVRYISPVDYLSRRDDLGLALFAIAQSNDNSFTFPGIDRVYSYTNIKQLCDYIRHDVPRVYSYGMFRDNLYYRVICSLIGVNKSSHLKDYI